MKIQLQSVGRVEAKPAIDFKVGDKMMWNYGETSIVTGIAKETASMITFNLSDGERRFKKTRLVAIA